AFLLVDEAHSLGVLGATGRGAHGHWGLPPDGVDIWTGSLSKAMASSGGFIAGSRALITFLQHEAAPFIFSAALSPAAAGAVRAAPPVLTAEPERPRRTSGHAPAPRTGLRRGRDRGGGGAGVRGPAVPPVPRRPVLGSAAPDR